MGDGRPVLRWSVVGVGRAGLARARAINNDKRSELAGVWRGRNAERFVLAKACTSLEEAIEVADGVAICSPSAAHPEQVEAALQAGRHVICEFPLATDPEVARRLFALARSKQRVLHVEHIELLHAPQITLRAHTRRDPVVKIRQEFARNGPDDISPEDVIAGNLARVHRVLDLCGPVARIHEVSRAPGLVSGTLEHEAGGLTRFRWEQSPYMQRFTKMRCRTASGAEWRIEGDALYRGPAAQTLVESIPLFEQDHTRAMARIQDGRTPYVSDERVVQAIALLGQLATA